MRIAKLIRERLFLDNGIPKKFWICKFPVLYSIRVNLFFTLLSSTFLYFLVILILTDAHIYKCYCTCTTGYSKRFNRPYKIVFIWAMFFDWTMTSLLLQKQYSNIVWCYARWLSLHKTSINLNCCRRWLLLCYCCAK